MRTGTNRARSTLVALPILAASSLTLAATLLLAQPAVAHPFVVGGGRVPVQSLATIQLDLAHGCGVETAGTGPDTDEVALEVPDWLRIVDAPEPDGWRITLEEADSVIVWEATTGAEPAPRFTLAVVVDGEAGETRYLRVSQRCGDRVERWIGTPDDPAEQPAVRLRLEPTDPSSPPPPLPDPRPEADPQPEAETDPDAAPDDDASPTDEAGPPGSMSPASDGPAVSPAGADHGRGGRGRTAAIAVVGGALALGAALAARRAARRSGEAG